MSPLSKGESPDLSGQVALVTGGGRGIGRAISVTLASSGAAVAVLARSPDQLAETVRLITASGGRAIACPADVTDRQAVEQAVDEVGRRLGPIDLLVNNAGQGRPFGPLAEVDPDEWWRCVEVNLRGPMLCSHLVLHGMIARRRGRIINVVSGAGTRAIPALSAYVTGKAALIRLTENLATEVKSQGITVFAMQPGTVRTAMAQDALESEEGRRWLPWLQEIFEQGVDVPPDRAARLVLFLASGRADALTGRFFCVEESAERVVEHAERVLQEDLNVLRLRTLV
jgi:NAD(P)-dependent dehydrogenase (short-subunit alcohol dehydrogenase family)